MKPDTLYQPKGIADFPELAELPAQDVAMDTFRMHYPLPIISARVSDDGLTMSYRLRWTMNSQHFLQVARLIIIGHDLPLEATLDEFIIGNRVFESNLIITYTGQ